MHLPPARIKRILANRESAARSKQRKLDYMMELENQVRPLTAYAVSPVGGRDQHLLCTCQITRLIVTVSCNAW